MLPLVLVPSRLAVHLSVCLSKSGVSPLPFFSASASCAQLSGISIAINNCALFGGVKQINDNRQLSIESNRITRDSGSITLSEVRRGHCEMHISPVLLARDLCAGHGFPLIALHCYAALVAQWRAMTPNE